MARYKLTFLGKFAIFIVVFIVVMVFVIVSTLIDRENGGNHHLESAPPSEYLQSPGIPPSSPSSFAPATPGASATPAISPPGASPSSVQSPPSGPALDPSATPVGASRSPAPNIPANKILGENITVFFSKMSAELDEYGMSEIDRFISLPDDPDDYLIIITGNSSSDESATSSGRKLLAQNRALAVMDYLKSAGVSEKSITLVINGSNNEIKSDDPDAAAISRNAGLEYALGMK